MSDFKSKCSNLRGRKSGSFSKQQGRSLTLLEFTSPIDREYMRRRRKFLRFKTAMFMFFDDRFHRELRRNRVFRDRTHPLEVQDLPDSGTCSDKNNRKMLFTMKPHSTLIACKVTMFRYMCFCVSGHVYVCVCVC